MPFAPINGLELYYEVTDFTRPWEGPSQALVLLHGLHGHLAWWNYYQTPTLAQHYRVVTLDQRGHGKSFKPASGYSIETMADDLYELLGRLNLSQVHLGGASMGGMVSLQFALAHPEMVRSLILIDSYAKSPGVLQAALEKWIADAEAKGYARVMETFNTDYATALFSPGFWARQPDFPAFETELVLKNLIPDAAFIGCCQAIQRFDVLEQLSEIKAPTLIVTPNAGLAYEEGLRMHQHLAHAELWTPEGVGHSVHIEIPDEFNERILQFLKQVDQS